ncbi:Gfo/Idh/MocA family protein [Rhizobium sp. 18055]|uniref:Gfo/Idh/MocA family protein n=1 Tax=Rhizobium sp. 18055 TaxID=2681403 RepID=UPI0013568724|nr:Gfo/Idh/MocA family oxidoreductase [Rhizobium sp. 18055]
MSYDLLADFGRPLRWGMVGGGTDSLIGETHRLAARVDGRYQLVTGCLSYDPAIAKRSAEVCLLEPSRSYTSFEAMAEAEANREDGVEVVTVCTPPHLHAAASEAFLKRDIAVLCEKPMTKNLAEARALKETVDSSQAKFALTHCYTGYPMVREARALISSGAIGAIRQIECDFVSGPFLDENPDRSKRHWRFLPEYMGTASILGEIGAHAINMISYTCGELPQSVLAKMVTLTPGREVADDAQILLQFPGNRIGRMWLSFVATGSEHGLAFRVFGDKGSLQWRQEQPEQLIHTPRGEYARTITSGHLDRLTPLGAHSCRLREGHPEGYVLAFANLYRDFADQIIGSRLGVALNPHVSTVPGADEGVETLRFFEACVRSNDAGSTWQNL